jgi:hypothetical protein
MDQELTLFVDEGKMTRGCTVRKSSTQFGPRAAEIGPGVHYLMFYPMEFGLTGSARTPSRLSD